MYLLHVQYVRPLCDYDVVSEVGTQGLKGCVWIDRAVTLLGHVIEALSSHPDDAGRFQH